MLTMDNNTSTKKSAAEAHALGGGAAAPSTAAAVLGAGPLARSRGAAADVLAQHRFDPRVMLACILLISASSFSAGSLAVEVAAVGGCALAGLWCGRPAAVLRWTAAWAALLAVSWLCVQSGALMAVGVSLTMIRRMLCAFMMAAHLVAVTRTGELACGLQRLGLPKRMTAALCVMLRFAPTLAQEFAAVRDAMKVRGIALTPARVLRHPAQVVENLLVPVVGRVGIVADELANAAAVRGIDAPERRTSYYELRLGAPDMLLLAFFVALAAFALAKGAGVIA